MNFVQNVTRLRQEKKLSLQDLANLSGVSKSMLSKIEREEKNPTLQIASQIAEGLGTTLSALLAENEHQPVILIKQNDRRMYRDEISGIERYLLSPAFSTRGIEFILYIIPQGEKSPEFPPHQKGVKEYITVSMGRLKIELYDITYELNAGDSIYFEANVRHKFLNIGDTNCHFYLVTDSHDIRRG